MVLQRSISWQNPSGLAENGGDHSTDVRFRIVVAWSPRVMTIMAVLPSWCSCEGGSVADNRRTRSAGELDLREVGPVYLAGLPL